MNWDTYNPLSTENVLHFEEYQDVIQGDMFGGQPDDPADNDSYLITHIDEDVFAFNYDTSQFEHLQRSVVKGWMENKRVFQPMLSSHAFTIESPDGTPVGIRSVGSAAQSEEMVKEYGPDVFSFHIGLVFEEGLPATEIEEPYSNDVYVTHPSLKCFVDEALTDLSDAISDKTAIGSDYSEELVRGILGTLEVNARTRLQINTESDSVVADTARDEMYVEEPKENERTIIFSEDSEEDQMIEFHGNK